MFLPPYNQLLSLNSLHFLSSFRIPFCISFFISFCIDFSSSFFSLLFLTRLLRCRRGALHTPSATPTRLPKSSLVRPSTLLHSLTTGTSTYRLHTQPHTHSLSHTHAHATTLSLSLSRAHTHSRTRLNTTTAATSHDHQLCTPPRNTPCSSLGSALLSDSAASVSAEALSDFASSVFRYDGSTK